MLAVIVAWFGLLAAVIKVDAFPRFFAEEHNGCKEVLPKKAYGGHQPPLVRDEITFTLSEDGKPVNEWVPGKTYELSTGDGNIEDEVQVWMHVTSGKLEGGSGSQAQCENGWHSGQAATTQTMEWTAPEEKACVVFSTAQASDSEAAYQTNTMEMCASGFSEAEELKKDISNQDSKNNMLPSAPGSMLMVGVMAIVVAAIVGQYAYRVMAKKNEYHLVNQVN